MPALSANKPQPSVLITGCSSGIGKACAVDLAELGWTVFAGVRREQDGTDLQAVAGKAIQPVLLDITDSNSISAAIHSLRERLSNQGLDAVVNNAGIVVPGPLELITTEQIRRQFEVNVFGTHALTNAVLPLLRDSKGINRKSRIVLIGSISGRITPPYFGAYAASKHAMEALADAWRIELSQWPIAVSIIQPDSIATPLWNKVSSGISDLSDDSASDVAAAYARTLNTTRRASLGNTQSGLPVKTVVAAVRHAVSARHPKSHYPVGWRTRAVFWASSFLPTRMLDFVLSKAVGG